MLNPYKVRQTILEMIFKRGSGHIGGSFSIIDYLTFLYNNPELNFIDRDKLILSKGHAVPALYGIFYNLGLIESLDTFRHVNSPLEGHPVHKKLPYLHATTGSLGQGLSIGIGHALHLAKTDPSAKVVVIVGDGELQEGQNWEAIMFAGNRNELSNLLLVVDENKAQNDGLVRDIMPLAGLAEKFEAFGWNVYGCPGHTYNKFFVPKSNFGPNVLILDTWKGYGVEFMLGEYKWHTAIPTQEEYTNAIAELEIKAKEWEIANESN